MTNRDYCSGKTNVVAKTWPPDARLSALEFWFSRFLLFFWLPHKGKKQMEKKLWIRFKKTRPTAVIPRRMSEGAAGFDLTATALENIDSYHTKYLTGIAVEIPTGFVGLVFPRSSVYKREQLLTNSVGVIDSDYRGEISFVYIGTAPEFSYKIGDRIGQLLIVRIPEVEFFEVEELSQTDRGTGGYGSTGR